jgi:ATP-dependent DNA helicase
MTTDFDEQVKQLIIEQEKQEDGEQNAFNHLSRNNKLDRLNNLIQKSQIYSQIIADNILQSSLKRKESVPKNQENGAKRRKRNDITAMLSSNISSSTKTTREAIEQSQSAHASTKQPRLLSGGTLKDYQLDGLQWLSTLFENGLNGILADEMGLGKTIQCIAFLTYLMEMGIGGPFLIIVPLLTLTNWCTEFAKFAPDVSVLKYSGSKEVRSRIAGVNLTKYNIVITSYEVSIKDFAKLNSVAWKYLIVDEGHRLKNNNCTLIRFLKKLNVSNRLLLTGTPLQNNLDELWSLLNFILPDIFHDLQLFQQWFNFDELTNLDKNADSENEETKSFIKLNIQQSLIRNLHTILKPFILRRLKRDVIKNLPPKKEYLIHIPLTNLQSKLYFDAIDNKLAPSLIEIYIKEFINYNHQTLFTSKVDFDLIDDFLTRKFENSTPKVSTTPKSHNYKDADSDDEFLASTERMVPELLEYQQVLPKICNRKFTRQQKQQMILDSLYTMITKQVRNMSLQNTMMQLRNICNSPYIYYEPFVISDSPKPEVESKFNEAFLQNSAKIQILDQICSELIANDHKLLIFSQFTKVLDLLHDWFNFKGILLSRLDGATEHSERDRQIKNFKDDAECKVFLLSTRAGGLGINLTAADTVILFDNDWNPQMDLQAIDRVHRIGQDRPVKIFRFLVRDSIEEILISRSSSKRFLEKLIIQMGEFKFNKIKKLIGGDENIDLNVKDLIDISKNTFRPNEDAGTSKKSSTPTRYVYKFSERKPTQNLLTKSELQELLDRSPECYQHDDDSIFNNISIFETVNNLDI